MQTKNLSPVRSVASGLVAYTSGWVNQSMLPHVDAPTQSIVVKDPMSLNAMGRSAAGKNSLAVSLDAICLRKAVMELRRHLRLIEDESGGWISIWLDKKPFAALEDVNPSCQIEVREFSFPASKQTQLLHKLHAAFEAEPLENGMVHPAEEIIRKAVQSSEDQQVFDWLESFSLDAEHPSFAASVLRCIGRQVGLGTYSWRAGLVRAGLSMDNVEIRDAVVQAAESWGDQELAKILRSHDETELWLRKYLLDVIDDLEE